MTRYCKVELDNSKIGLRELTLKEINQFVIICPMCKKQGSSNMMCDNFCQTAYCVCKNSFHYDYNTMICLNGHDPNCGR
jgi:hypothetical protein